MFFLSGENSLQSQIHKLESMVDTLSNGCKENNRMLKEKLKNSQVTSFRREMVLWVLLVLCFGLWIHTYLT
jgi:hypothetical protein